MSKTQSLRKANFAFMLRKFFVSGFVVFTFVAYSLHERAVNPDDLSSILIPTKNPSQTQITINVASTNATSIPSTANPSLQVVASPSVEPTITAIPTIQTKPKGRYKDGEYTGSSADAYYGMVQVKAIIQDGKIEDVQFLEYPNHRRTSQYINSIAMPDLTYEAIQAQNANVDIISGATLTSEAFIQSLQSALNDARNI